MADRWLAQDCRPVKYKRALWIAIELSGVTCSTTTLRIARFDLLRSINFLARNVTKWTTDDDAKLYHLMCYVNSSLSKRMVGWVGDTFDKLSVSPFADADFAGCSKSLRSTSGSHMHIQGVHTRFLLSGGSKRQGCVSHSTPEAEIVAADVTLRTMGLPALSICCC